MGKSVAAYVHGVATHTFGAVMSSLLQLKQKSTSDEDYFSRGCAKRNGELLFALVVLAARKRRA